MTIIDMEISKIAQPCLQKYLLTYCGDRHGYNVGTNFHWVLYFKRYFYS